MQADRTPIILVNELFKKFSSVVAVDKLSFEVNAGEIFALLGPNGAGKTTTIKMIMSMLKPDNGSMLFEGHEITYTDNSYKARLGYVPESCALYENLTGREYLEFFGNLQHLPADLINHKAESLLGLLDMDTSADKLIREYSKGMKQKILIISALLHDPDLIILDEPFSGLDANSVAIFKQILREEVQNGKAVIFCSHILEVVERLVDRILIINNGRKLVAGTPEEIIQKTGLKSLDKAFSQLTGVKDIDQRARRIVDTIRGNKNTESDEKQ